MFDVDETLEITGGPVKFTQLINLHSQGHIIGLCGNFAAVTLNTTGWHHLFSLIKITGGRKHEWLTAVKKYIPADRYIMIGNTNPQNSPYSDREEAQLANWEYIEEKQFKEGL